MAFCELPMKYSIMFELFAAGNTTRHSDFTYEFLTTTVYTALKTTEIIKVNLRQEAQYAIISPTHFC